MGILKIITVIKVGYKLVTHTHTLTRLINANNSPMQPKQFVKLISPCLTVPDQ